MGDSKIEYVTKTWNVCTGCTPDFSCWPRCWARAYHARWRKDFTPTFHPAKLDEPLHWRKPQRVAVAFLGDLFHERITDEQIAAVFGVMAAAPRHTFFLATKRAKRMRAWFEWLAARAEQAGEVFPAESLAWRRRHCLGAAALNAGARIPERCFPLATEVWPLPNVWPGVSAEDQTAADKRLPELLATPAAHRWVSLEPLLGPVNLLWRLKKQRLPGDLPPLDFVVVGGESSQGGQPARPCDVAWIRAVVEQCRAAGVPVYVKQDSGAGPGGQGRIPNDLWAVKELPAGIATEAKP